MKNNFLFIVCLFNIFICQYGIAQSAPSSSDTINSCKSGMEHFNNYQFDKAIEMLRLCYQRDAQNIDCLKRMAYCNYKLGRFSAAKNNYYSILEKDSMNLTAINQLAVIYAKESQYNRAIEQYQTLISLDSANSFYYKQIALLSLKLGNIENSIPYFERAHNINPQDISVITELSSIYQKLYLYAKAGSLITKGLLLDSNNVRLLLTRSRIAYKLKNYKTVIQTVSRILKFQDDTSAYMMKLLGVSHYYLDNLEMSISLLERVIRNEEESEVIHYYLGLANRSKGQLQKSVFHFEQAINQGISNNISTYYTNLALAFEEKKKYKQSIKAYQAAYNSSKNKILLYHLARNYDAYYEDKKTALRYYEKYLALNDSGHIEFKDYSKHRISQLRQSIHFTPDTLE